MLEEAHGATLRGLLCRFIRLVGPRANMTAAEKLSLMVAALCHDMDHPGVPSSRPCRRNHSLCLCCQLHMCAYVTQGALYTIGHSKLYTD